MTKFLWLLLVVLNALSVWLVVSFEYHHLHDENGLFENLQVLLLGLGVLFGSLLLRGAGDQLLVWAGFALLCFSLVLREVDLNLLPLPPLLQALGTGEGRAALLLPLWGGLGWGFLRLGRQRWIWLRAVLGGPVVAFALLALALLLGAALVDRGLIVLAQPRLAEELLELNAYALLIWPAVLAFRRLWYPARVLPAC